MAGDHRRHHVHVRVRAHRIAERARHRADRPLHAVGNERREAVREWLLKAPAKDTEDRVFRLLALKDAPEQVNTDPHGAWMVAIRMDSGSEADDLLSAAAYAGRTSTVHTSRSGRARGGIT